MFVMPRKPAQTYDHRRQHLPHTVVPWALYLLVSPALLIGKPRHQACRNCPGFLKFIAPPFNDLQSHEQRRFLLGYCTMYKSMSSIPAIQQITEIVEEDSLV